MAGVALATVIVCGGGTAIDGAVQTTAARTAGLFTDAQAASGETVYRQSCASCHGADLSGGSADGTS